MKVAQPGEGFVVRLDDLHARLASLADLPPPRDLTEPDPSTGERWDRGQVWAHMVEMIPYWIEQAHRILDAEGDEPVPFGRIKTDPGRIARIEAGRHEPLAGQWERLAGEIGDLKAFVGGLAEADWRRRGTHPTLGVMDIEGILERFLVGHLEEHVEQLEAVIGGAPSPGSPTG